MKFAILLSVFFALNVFAQTAQIKDIPLDKETNITISPDGKKSPSKTHEIVDETADIEGEPENLQKDARASWKKACAEWKAETKETNKENKIISLNCGSPKCASADTATTVCKSQAKMKVKVKVE